MAKISSIEWTESTWNPVTGCSKISTGCENCYALRLATRLKAMGNKNYKNGFEVVCHEDVLSKPLDWKTPRVIFVNSMSDILHKEIPFDFIKAIFDVIKLTPYHTYQILTKRSDRMALLADQLEWHENIWMGVTVKAQSLEGRIDDLRSIPAHVKFLSLEPLLSPMSNLDLSGIDWVIVGGESGPKCRIMRKEWVESIRNQCAESNVPFFFKQWGGTNKKESGRYLNGRTYSEMPTSFMRRAS